MTVHVGKLYFGANFSFCSFLILLNGTMASSYLMVKNSKINAGESDCELDTFLTDTRGCNRVYYYCTKGLTRRVLIEFSCQRNCCFDVDIRQCVCIDKGGQNNPIGRRYASKKSKVNRVHQIESKEDSVGRGSEYKEERQVVATERNTFASRLTTVRPCKTGVFECPMNPGEGPMLFEDPNDCRYYFDCMSSEAYRRDCGAGMHLEGDRCVRGLCPSAVPGCKPLSQGRKCKTGYFECPEGTSKLRLPDVNNCRFYFVCKNGYAVRKDCGECRHFGLTGKCINGSCSHALPNCKPQKPRPVPSDLLRVAKARRSCKTGVFECPAKHPSNFYIHKDPNNCRYFFLCYSDGAYRYDCGPGKHLERGKCVSGTCPSAIPKCKPLRQGRDCKFGVFKCPAERKGRHKEVVPDSNNCRYFFVCLGGKAERRDCGVGNHFENNQCIPGNCSYALPNCKPQETQPVYVVSQPPTRSLGGGFPIPVPKPPVQPSKFEIQGARTCSKGYFECPLIHENGMCTYEDPNNCRYYFECSSDGTFRHDCGPGNHLKSGACVSGDCPYAIANCEPLSLRKETIPTRECKPGRFECPASLSNGSVFVEDLNDCRYFFACSPEGYAAKGDCGRGKHWKNGRCIPGVCPYAIPKCKPQKPLKPTVRPSRPRNKKKTCVTGVFNCPKESTGISLRFVDPNDCRYYFDCHSSGAYRQDCGHGKHFDGRMCVDGACPSVAPNCPLLSQGRACNSGLFSCPPGANGQGFPDVNDCRYYFICFGGLAERKDCGEGSHFRADGRCANGQCSYALPDCEPQEPRPASLPVEPPKLRPPARIKATLRPCVRGVFKCTRKPPNGTYYTEPDPNDCRYYYECFVDGPYRKDCGEGMHFEERRCVAGKCPGALPQCRKLEQGRVCKTGKFECPAGSSEGRVIEDPNDCRYYFVCNKDSVQRRDCGAGRHFEAGDCEDGTCISTLPDCRPMDSTLVLTTNAPPTPIPPPPPPDTDRALSE